MRNLAIEFDLLRGTRHTTSSSLSAPVNICYGCGRDSPFLVLSAAPSAQISPYRKTVPFAKILEHEEPRQHKRVHVLRPVLSPYATLVHEQEIALKGRVNSTKKE